MGFKTLEEIRQEKEQYIRSHIKDLKTYYIKRGTLYGAWILHPIYGQCGTQIYASKMPTKERFIQGILNYED